MCTYRTNHVKIQQIGKTLLTTELEHAINKAAIDKSKLFERIGRKDTVQDLDRLGWQVCRNSWVTVPMPFSAWVFLFDLIGRICLFMKPVLQGDSLPRLHWDEGID